MAQQSLKTTLLLAVASLVVASCLLTALLASQRYARSLEDALTAQARTVAQNLSAQLADLVLTNDLAGVQRLLDRQTGDANVGYAFVLKGGSILAHTFDGGVPTDLLSLNSAPAGDRGSVRKVRFSSGPAYLDVAWPIFEGRAGELRLGFSERQRSAQISRLWLETASITLSILAVALTGGMLFLRRVTRPFATLVTAIREIGQGNLNVRVDAEGQAEIALVADAFNTMTARLEQYTRQIEENAAALQRSHSQMRISNEIVLGVAGLGSLQEAGEFLLQRIREMLRCRDVALLFFGSGQQAVFVVSDEGIGVVRDAEVVERAVHALEGCDRVTHFAEPVFAPPLVPESIARRPRQMVMPLLHEQRISGALVAGCKGECACSSEEMGVAGLVLGQAAGSIRRVLHYEEELRDLRMRLDGTAGFSGIIGKDPKMQQIFKLIDDVASSDATVLITGESGTGKELVAQAIHQRSPRRGKPFVVINCSAYPSTLLESELFGHERGAFTGADRQKPGRFELADGGTVFLDEIGEISPTAQVKLLRVLQTRQFERIGGEKAVSVDVRVLAATNRDLMEEVRAGRFRDDLYYRLDVISVPMPSLRERPNDIPLLARHFLARYGHEQGGAIPGIGSAAMRLLLNYSWPGNVRELENVMEQAVILARGDVLTPADLPARLHAPVSAPVQSMEVQEQRLIRDALESAGWNKKLAASRLGIGRTTLYAKMKRYGIAEPASEE